MDYVNIKIPKSLGEKIDHVLKRGHYTSRAEFVKDAVRRRLEAFKDNTPTLEGIHFVNQ